MITVFFFCLTVVHLIRKIWQRILQTEYRIWNFLEWHRTFCVVVRSLYPLLWARWRTFSLRSVYMKDFCWLRDATSTFVQLEHTSNVNLIILGLGWYSKILFFFLTALCTNTASFTLKFSIVTQWALHLIFRFYSRLQCSIRTDYQVFQIPITQWTLQHCHTIWGSWWTNHSGKITAKLAHPLRTSKNLSSQQAKNVLTWKNKNTKGWPQTKAVHSSVTDLLFHDRADIWDSATTSFSLSTEFLSTEDQVHWAYSRSRPQVERLLFRPWPLSQPAHSQLRLVRSQPEQDH